MVKNNLIKYQSTSPKKLQCFNPLYTTLKKEDLNPTLLKNTRAPFCHLLSNALKKMPLKKKNPDSSQDFFVETNII